MMELTERVPMRSTAPQRPAALTAGRVVGAVVAALLVVTMAVTLISAALSSPTTGAEVVTVAGLTHLAAHKTKGADRKKTNGKKGKARDRTQEKHDDKKSEKKK